MKLDRRTALGGALFALGASAIPAAARPLPAQDVRDRLDAHLRTYASLGSKLSGGPGDIASGHWIARELEHYGFAVERQSFPVPTFDTRVATLRAGDQLLNVAPQPVVVQTPAEGITAAAVLVRNAEEAKSAKDRIAIFVLPYGRHASIFSPRVQEPIDAAAAAGARAIVIVTTGPTGKIIGLNTRLTPMAPVPIALLAPTDLPAIEQAIAAAQPLTLTLNGTNATGHSLNVIARRKAGPKWIVFSTPRSGWGPAVGERAPGTAIFLELCRWAVATYPDHSIFALNSGGHELDFSGAHHALPSAPPPADTIVWTHLGAGLATRDAKEEGGRLTLLPTADPNRRLMAAPVILDQARSAFAGLSGYEQPGEPVKGAGELSTILDRGYEKAFAGLGVHRWCHVEDDGLDQVDVALLLPVFEAHRRLVEEIVRHDL